MEGFRPEGEADGNLTPTDIRAWQDFCDARLGITRTFCEVPTSFEGMPKAMLNVASYMEYIGNPIPMVQTQEADSEETQTEPDSEETQTEPAVEATEATVEEVPVESVEQDDVGSADVDTTDDTEADAEEDYDQSTDTEQE
jgi:hypothetical protein